MPSPIRRLPRSKDNTQTKARTDRSRRGALLRLPALLKLLQSACFPRRSGWEDSPSRVRDQGGVRVQDFYAADAGRAAGIAPSSVSIRDLISQNCQSERSRAIAMRIQRRAVRYLPAWSWRSASCWYGLEDHGSMLRTCTARSIAVCKSPRAAATWLAEIHAPATSESPIAQMTSAPTSTIPIVRAYVARRPRPRPSLGSRSPRSSGERRRRPTREPETHEGDN